MALNLENKSVVVTGAARGIGKAIATEFARQGAHIVIGDILDEVGTSAASEIAAMGVRCEYRHCDVTSRADVESLMACARDSFGRLDVAVANAGLVKPTDALELDEKEFDLVMGINLKGAFLTGQIAARMMLEQAPDACGTRGVVINISSVMETSVLPEAASYCMSKGGLAQWNKALAIRVAPNGIRVNAIGPGSIETELNTQIDDKERFRALMSRTPMGRSGRPEEIGRIATFLASDLSSYITGQTIYADGGRMALNLTVSAPQHAGEP